MCHVASEGGPNGTGHHWDAAHNLETSLPLFIVEQSLQLLCWRRSSPCHNEIWLASVVAGHKKISDPYW